MDKRTNILAQIEAIESDQTVDDLKQQLADVRSSIENHELEVAKRRAIELAREIETAEATRTRKLGTLERQLESEMPQQLFDIRSTVYAAFARHQISNIPQFLPPQPHTRPEDQPKNEDYHSWRQRGESLCELSRELRDLWRRADWADRLQQLIDQHAPHVAELRNVRIEESASV